MGHLLCMCVSFILCCNKQLLFVYQKKKKKTSFLLLYGVCYALCNEFYFSTPGKLKILFSFFFFLNKPTHKVFFSF